MMASVPPCCGNDKVLTLNGAVLPLARKNDGGPAAQPDTQRTQYRATNEEQLVRDKRMARFSPARRLRLESACLLPRRIARGVQHAPLTLWRSALGQRAGCGKRNAIMRRQ